MSQQTDLQLQQQLKKMNFNELTDLAKIAIKSDNIVLLKLIEKQNKKVLVKDSQLGKDKESIFSICKYGTVDVLNYFVDKKYDFSAKEESTGNKCQHFASIYGNITLLNELVKKKDVFDMNEQNLKNETALHVALKYGCKQNKFIKISKHQKIIFIYIQLNKVYRYEKTTMFLTRFTDLALKDDEMKEPHRIRMKNFKQNVRLSEYLHEKYMKQKNRQQLTTLPINNENTSNNESTSKQQ